MEHGFISHSTTPYEELVRVPLIVKLPGGAHAGRVVEEQVRLVDVMPTVLAAVGLPAPDGVAGCNLLPLLDGGEGARPASCRDAVIEIAEEGAAPVVAVRTAGWKYIHHERRPPELYDLVADPGERVNLAAQPGQEGERLRRLALAVSAERLETQAERIELDEETIRELKALGYVR
jgi:arylsulfatase A-like enzyme